MGISKEIAELVGMHIGDGTLYKTNWGLVWELRGDIKEKEYYIFHVAPLVNGICGITLTPKLRSGGKNGCFGVQTSKKEVTQLFLGLGFKPGPKTKTVKIPLYIKSANKKIKYSFLRGYFDTDGCLRFDKNRTKKYYYPRIEFCSASFELIDELSVMLNGLGFRNYVWGSINDKKLCIAGENMLEKWMKFIGTKNTKHLNKYLEFQKYGFVSMPRWHNPVLR